MNCSKSMIQKIAVAPTGTHGWIIPWNAALACVYLIVFEQTKRRMWNYHKLMCTTRAWLIAAWFICPCAPSLGSANCQWYVGACGFVTWAKGVKLNFDVGLGPPVPLGLTGRQMESCQTLKLVCSAALCCYKVGIRPPVNATKSTLCFVLSVIPGGAFLSFAA